MKSTKNNRRKKQMKEQGIDNHIVDPKKVVCQCSLIRTLANSILYTLCDVHLLTRAALSPSTSKLCLLLPPLPWYMLNTCTCVHDHCVDSSCVLVACRGCEAWNQWKQGRRQTVYGRVRLQGKADRDVGEEAVLDDEMMIYLSRSNQMYHRINTRSLEMFLCCGGSNPCGANASCTE